MVSPGSNTPEGLLPIGQEWLRRELALAVPALTVESYIVQGARRTAMDGLRTLEFYPRQYAVGSDIASHLRFALRYEPIDLSVLVAALKAIRPAELEAWVRREPTGAYSRRAWFFYETFTGRTADLEDVRSGNYVEALDSERYIVADRRNSARHRVIDNLLGGRALCPTVRRSSRLVERMGIHIDQEARALIDSYDPIILARAVNYLYTKETRSSFAIERETPSAGRTDRFVAALRAAPAFVPNKQSLVQLQNAIVDPRYAAHDWRDFQNFVGETLSGYREEVRFICPLPQDVPSLMDGWIALTDRVVNSTVDPVIAAAVSSFAFVFIHPFADGNGRIHRFLMHHILAKRGYSPAGVIFPVSAAILRDRHGYDRTLEAFSKPLVDLITWHWTSEQEIAVTNDTADLYRYFDATVFAEYLYDRVADTVRRDLKEELGFIAIFDRAFNSVREIVDMPDRRAALFVRLCMQNSGHLSAAKRSHFAELTDAEITRMETEVQEAMTAQTTEHP
jgi:Fic family protein